MDGGNGDGNGGKGGKGGKDDISWRIEFDVDSVDKFSLSSLNLESMSSSFIDI